MLDDPEAFLLGFSPKKRLILDEIHRLDNPSQVLKIAADHFPKIKVLATGSSTLGASSKFKDTLAGRKTELWLTPMINTDLHDFGGKPLKHRLHRGGLPPFFLADRYPEADFQEWMDAYWAKDVQELFRVERRNSFQKFVELLLLQSGGIFEATRFAGPCEISRPTVTNYLSVLESTYVAHVLKPFSSRRTSEIISAPKVYGFDTGFVAYYRGWNDLRREDMGYLWEHYVLNELHASAQAGKVQYWRNKQGHEIDFVLVPRGQPPVAIECKLSADQFVPNHLQSFRHHYSKGPNYVVCTDVSRPYTKSYGDLQVEFVDLETLTSERLA